MPQTRQCTDDLYVCCWRLEVTRYTHYLWQVSSFFPFLKNHWTMKPLLKWKLPSRSFDMCLAQQPASAWAFLHSTLQKQFWLTLGPITYELVEVAFSDSDSQQVLDGGNSEEGFKIFKKNLHAYSKTKSQMSCSTQNEPTLYQSCKRAD